MLYLLVFAALLFFASGKTSLSWNKEFKAEELKVLELKTLFQEWKQYFTKEYKTIEEEGVRYAIWSENLYKVAEENSKNLTYRLRLNQFGDLTGDEFKYKINGKSGSCLKPEDKKRKLPRSDALKLKSLNVPSSIDWTDYNGKSYVTPVKNQGDCGSCWAFSAVACTECRYAIDTGTLNDLSEQQVVDCSDSYGNDGCDGGWMDYAFEYIIANGGLCTETAYPYTGEDGTCKSTSCGKFYNPMSSYLDVGEDDETDLVSATATGCVSVGIEADQFAFQYYSSGILTGTCGTTVDHGVTVVGYGTSGSQDYWKVKNSWGDTWGDAGYVFICRACNDNGDEGECGINMYPSYDYYSR
jgi:xylem cysteine proteinase